MYTSKDKDTYLITLDEVTSWSRIGGGAFIGLVSAFFLIAALKNLDDVEVPFILGAVVCTIGGPIYAFVQYRRLVSPYALLRADKVGFRLNGGGPMETVEWQDVDAIELVEAWGEEVKYTGVLKITLAGDLGKTVNYNSEIVTDREQIYIVAHTVRGVNSSHLEALRALWRVPTAPENQAPISLDLKKAPAMPTRSSE